MSEKQNWIDKSLRSTEGMKRANAPEGLFAKIQHQIEPISAKIITLSQIRTACAIAAMLLLLNGVLCTIYLKNNSQKFVEQIDEKNKPSNSLVSDYNIYN